GVRRTGPVEGVEEARDDRAPDGGRVERADAGGPHGRRDHRLGGGAMAARRAELAEGGLDDLAGRADVADVADRDVDLLAGETRDDRPLDPLDLEAQVGE